MKKITAALCVAAFALAACSSEESKKNDAQAAIKATLQKPDTAEFSALEVGKADKSLICGKVGYRAGDIDMYQGEKPFIYQADTKRATILADRLDDIDFKLYYRFMLDKQDTPEDLARLKAQCHGPALWEANCSPALNFRQNDLCQLIEKPHLLEQEMYKRFGTAQFG